MTDDGNHGGESDLEIESALFVYSPSMKFQKNSITQEIPQIDFVPSISLLLNLPIPFGNLGKLIPDFFRLEDLKKLYFLNLKQLFNYFKEYSSIDSNFSSFLQRIDSFLLEENFEIEKFQILFKEISDDCRNIWSTFNLPLMVIGIIFVFLTLFQLNLWNEGNSQIHFIFIILNFISLVHQITMFCSFLISFVYLITFQRKFTFNLNLERSVSIFFLILYSVSFSSNSFIIYEDRIILFFMMTIGLFSLLYMKNINQWMHSILFMLMIRFSKFSIHFRNHGTHLMNMEVYTYKRIIVVISLFMIFIVINIGQKRSFHLYSLSVLGLIFVYWEFKFNDVLDSLWIPRIVYLSTIVYMIISKERNFKKIFSIFILVFIMLKGPEFSFSFLFLIIQTFLLLEMGNFKKFDDFLMTFVWILLAKQYFFSLGQQNTFNTINWNAGFVGIEEANNLSGVLVVMNIFAPQILFSFLFPFISNCFKEFLIIKGVVLGFNMIFTMVLRRHLVFLFI
jgi:hypothetical protein